MKCVKIKFTKCSMSSSWLFRCIQNSFVDAVNGQQLIIEIICNEMIFENTAKDKKAE